MNCELRSLTISYVPLIFLISGYISAKQEHLRFGPLEYEAWCEQAGVKLHGGVRIVQQAGELHVFVSDGIRSGEVLAEIPWTSIISSETFASSDEGSQVVADFTTLAKGHSLVTADSQFHRFILAVAAAAANPASSFHRLALTLSEGDQPLWWTDADLEEIRGSMLFEALKESKDEMEASRDIMCRALKGRGLACTHLRHARTAALQGAFMMEQFGGKGPDMRLVPVVHLAKRRLVTTDMQVGLRPTATGLVWIKVGGEEGTGVVSPAALKMDSLQLLWHYGRVELENPNNAVLKVFRGEKALERHAEANYDRHSRGGVKKRLRRAVQLQGEKFRLQSRLAWVPPTELVVAIRLVTCQVQDVDCSRLLDGETELLPRMEDEVAVWKAVTAALRSHRARYKGGTFQEDLLRVPTTGSRNHTHLAVMYRAVEKGILDDNIRYCASQVARIEGSLG